MTPDQLNKLIAAHTKKPRAKADGGLVPKLLKSAAQLGIKLWRNQVGTYKLADGRYMSSGLCVGSSDLIGFTQVTITPEMVGRHVAVFTAIEAKAKDGKARDNQLDFIDTIRKAGGIAGIVHSVDELGIIMRSAYGSHHTGVREGQGRNPAGPVARAPGQRSQAGSVYRG